MSAKVLSSKYIDSAEKVMATLEQVDEDKIITKEQVQKILGYVKDYLEDAKYYKVQERFETSLTSVAYCEGLLDALRLLGTVRFEWPTKNAEIKKK
jgi:FAD synthetase